MAHRKVRSLPLMQDLGAAYGGGKAWAHAGRRSPDKDDPTKIAFGRAERLKPLRLATCQIRFARPCDLVVSHRVTKTGDPFCATGSGGTGARRQTDGHVPKNSDKERCGTAERIYCDDGMQA